MENKTDFENAREDINENFKNIRRNVLMIILATLVHAINGIFVVYSAITNSIGLVYDILASAICVYVIMSLFICFKGLIKNYKLYIIYKGLIKITKVIEEGREWK